MTREIKFRAYHFGADYSVRPEMLYDTKLGDVLRWKQEGQDLSDVMQYTGLKDINDVEIYEGDILDFGYIVTYVDGSQGANLGMNVGFYEQRDNFESWVQLEVGLEYEVKGNIYESEREQS